MSVKKYTQNDLRRLMQEQKLKSTKVNTSNTPTAEKIDSPLAKYENGQLNCILCKSVVRSEAVWKVHINSKNHREKVATAKELKNHLLNQSSTRNNNNQKRPSKHDVFLKPNIPAKKTKTENVEIKQDKSDVPTDFFDQKSSYFESTLNKTSIKKDLVNIRRKSKDETKMEVEETEEDEKLPEGFFDDPKKDAKIRNTEYKDPQSEEWERFQREIKEVTTHSIEIIADDNAESISERQFDEIDEQLKNWSKVLDMEKKTEKIISTHNQNRLNKMDEDNSENDSDNDVDEVDLENLTDWRAKRLTMK